MTQSGLLDYAEAIIDGKIELRACGPRAAALLARCVFEQWLDEQCSSWVQAAQPRPTTRSKLVVLGTRQGRKVGQEATRLWAGLSRAVHQHAYELQPSASEVRALVFQVRVLCE